METTFNIADHEDKFANPASYPQCKGLGWKFGKKPDGKMDNAIASRVTACLYSAAKEGDFSFKQADALFKKKSLPKKYVDSIAAYLEANS
jgi:hypothetical protein|tara:strand:- start:733 stop:1002 length:270 start_codon:yes stop_codon:yes gene_type:complete